MRDTRGDLSPAYGLMPSRDDVMGGQKSAEGIVAIAQW